MLKLHISLCWITSTFRLYIIMLFQKMNKQNKPQQSQYRSEEHLANEVSSLKIKIQNSERSQGSSQNIEDYAKMVQQLSEGIYVSSDNFTVEQTDENQEQVKEPSLHNDDNYDDERFQSVMEFSQHFHKGQISAKQPKYVEIGDEEEAQVTKQKNLQSGSTYQVSNKQVNGSLTEEQNQFNQSILFVYPSMMEESLSENYSNIKLEKIQERDSMEEQTNQIHLSFKAQKQALSNTQNAARQSRDIIDKSILLGQIVKEDKQKAKAIIENPKKKLNFQALKQVDLSKYTEIYEGQRKVRITGYQKQYFLKVQTQVFHIQVQSKEQTYLIKRRYADFANLSQLIKHHFSGAILYPFPQNSLELVKKLKFSMGSNQQRAVYIEKRLFQLEKYMNCLLNHHQILQSNILEGFLTQSNQQYAKIMKEMQNVVIQQEKEMQFGEIKKNLTNIKKMVQSRFSFFGYLSAPEIDPKAEAKLNDLKIKVLSNNQLFDTIKIQVSQCQQKLNSFLAKIQRLQEISKINSEIGNIQSNIDSVLKISSKLISSSTFYGRYAEWVQDSLLYHVKYYIALLSDVRQWLQYRIMLQQKINIVTVEHLGVAIKVEERLIFFNKRFIEDWLKIYEEIEGNLPILLAQSRTGWKRHCAFLSKIWQ